VKIGPDYGPMYSQIILKLAALGHSLRDLKTKTSYKFFDNVSYNTTVKKNHLKNFWTKY